MATIAHPTALSMASVGARKSSPTELNSRRHCSPSLSAVRGLRVYALGTSEDRKDTLLSETVTKVACGLCAALTVATSFPSFAASKVRLPPLSTDPARCERAYDGNTIGQANGVSNVILDLRFCDYSNDVTNLKGKTLSSALMTSAKFDGADLSEVIMSKAYAVGASFKGATFRNAVVDRVAFDNSDLRGVKFTNTVLSGSTFDGANLKDATFQDALIGSVEALQEAGPVFCFIAIGESSNYDGSLSKPRHIRNNLKLLHGKNIYSVILGTADELS